MLSQLSESFITASVLVVMVTINKKAQFTFMCLISADVFVPDLVSREITSPAERTGEDDLAVTEEDLRLSLCNIMCVFLSDLRFLQRP